MSEYHSPVPSLIPGVCARCGERDDEHVVYGRASVSPLRQEAVARRSDPITSHEAARSVRGIRESQAEILALYAKHGAMTDEMARSLYHGRQSLSGFRTRRSELVAAGRLVDTGRRVKGATGRRMIVWGIRAEEGAA